jgi:hypothetical protein
MDKNKKSNFKKLLCYNIVNNIKCVYKNKCMFAHNISEQLKESNREFIHNMIYTFTDLSNINVKENKELFEELMIFTKECKNCINKRCPGGYNCKFGVCLKELKICYNDLLNGKCTSALTEENANGIIIKKCYYGIHLTEKNLIPYYQRISCEINMLDYGIFLFNNINYYSKINTISVMLNDNTIKFIKNFITKNKINKFDINKSVGCNDKYNINFLINETTLLLDSEEKKVDNSDTLDEDILREYQEDKFNDSLNSLDDYFWRYNQHNLKNNESYGELIYYNNDQTANNITNENDTNNLTIKDEDELNNTICINEKLKNVIKIIDEIDDFTDEELKVKTEIEGPKLNII